MLVTDSRICMACGVYYAPNYQDTFAVYCDDCTSKTFAQVLEHALPQITYKFDEDKILAELKTYIDNTYGEHYANGKYQATDMICDAGHGESFCIGNVMKYAMRYGKKEGKNRKDLLKIIHYSIIALSLHDKEAN